MCFQKKSFWELPKVAESGAEDRQGEDQRVRGSDLSVHGGHGCEYSASDGFQWVFCMPQKILKVNLLHSVSGTGNEQVKDSLVFHASGVMRESIHRYCIIVSDMSFANSTLE